MNIQDMSNRQLEEVIHMAQVELQERQLRIDCEDALNNHLYVGEIEDTYRGAYISYLEERSNDLPLADEILSEWYSQQDRKQSMNTTGA